VVDANLRQHIIDECLVPYLKDRVDAWDMRADGRYQRVLPLPSETSHCAQAALVARYSSPYKG
jgi:polyphosphate kinase